MATATLAREVAKMKATLERQTAPVAPILDRLRRDPARLLADARRPPDPWQAALLRSPSPQTLLNCSRQTGKSTVSAALALRSALLDAPALVLLLSPTLRQSGELFLKVLELYRALGRPVPSLRPRDNVLRLELVNGSRIISLPGTEATIRGYSGAALLVIDEAARVDDGLYYAVRPMLAVSGGRLICLSTPYGKRGWFHQEWTEGAGWERVRITAWECLRIRREFLEQERRAIGERWFKQEYECEFMETLDSVFAYADIHAALESTGQTIPFPE